MTVYNKNFTDFVGFTVQSYNGANPPKIDSGWAVLDSGLKKDARKELAASELLSNVTFPVHKIFEFSFTAQLSPTYTGNGYDQFAVFLVSDMITWKGYEFGLVVPFDLQPNQVKTYYQGGNPFQFVWSNPLSLDLTKPHVFRYKYNKRCIFGSNTLETWIDGVKVLSIPIPKSMGYSNRVYNLVFTVHHQSDVVFSKNAIMKINNLNVTY